MHILLKLVFYKILNHFVYVLHLLYLNFFNEFIGTRDRSVVRTQPITEKISLNIVKVSLPK